MCVTEVGHASVPRPQVSDHDVSRAALGLDRGANFGALLLGPVYYRRDRVAQTGYRIRFHIVGSFRLELVVRTRLQMRSEPELGGSALDGEVAERNVGDKVIGVLGVGEAAAVLVRRLSHAARVGKRRVRCEPVPDRGRSQIANREEEVRS